MAHALGTQKSTHTDNRFGKSKLVSKSPALQRGVSIAPQKMPANRLRAQQINDEKHSIQNNPRIHYMTAFTNKSIKFPD